MPAGCTRPKADWQRELRRSPVRVRWDPERGIHLQPPAWRAGRAGLRGEAVRRSADEWIRPVTDVTEVAGEVRRTRDHAPLPTERPYPLTGPAAVRVGAAARQQGGRQPCWQTMPILVSCQRAGRLVGP
ncbi:DUF4291 family protein [Kitasatospora sp. NPDC050463]|uniref:DUF4291 family protein n=1 Tax=Kitasatospora sp. NPDC050463 TaxID=3155786 RepID=UPI0033F3F396